MSERPPAHEPSHPATAAALFWSFVRLGLTAFGGPAMVPYIGDLAIRRRRWLSPEEFREGVALCQAIPGATAMQTAAYVGLRAGGVRGAAAAYAGFALPAALLMLAASVAYERAVGLATVQAAFRGFQGVIVALIAHAALRVARVNVRSVPDALIGAACVLALYVKASPVSVIAGAILLCVAIGRARPLTRPPRALPPTDSPTSPKIAARAVLGLLGGGTAVLLALLLLAPRLGTLAAICIKVDALAFGGGFASVPLMYREMVSSRSWLDAKTFMDGIALGQVTPGPIVITATFVGYQVAGLAGALVATVAIFFPSFVMVLAVAPSFASLSARAWFGSALHGALLSFVGLLAFVAFQFTAAVGWTAGAGALAGAAFVALLAGLDVLWVVLGAGAIAAIAF